MQRIVVTLLAAIVVATPLGAQTDSVRPAPKDSAVKDSIARAAKAAAATKQATSAGEVALPKGLTAKTDSAAAKPRLATFKCKDGTQSFDADSSKACVTNGGVDSVFKKAPKP